MAAAAGTTAAVAMRRRYASATAAAEDGYRTGRAGSRPTTTAEATAATSEVNRYEVSRRGAGKSPGGRRAWPRQIRYRLDTGPRGRDPDHDRQAGGW